VAKEPNNSGKQWVDQKAKQLRQLVKENTPTSVIGMKLGRTEEAVRLKASGGENMFLKQTSRSPYNRTKD